MELNELITLQILLKKFLKQELIVNDEENVGCWYDVLIHRIEQQTPSILTYKEKAYLSAVIEPFKDIVEFIEKRGFDGRNYIRICLSNCEDICLPWFNEDTMYKGMQLDKEYTLKELGLE